MISRTKIKGLILLMICGKFMLLTLTPSLSVHGQNIAFVCLQTSDFTVTSDESFVAFTRYFLVWHFGNTIRIHKDQNGINTKSEEAKSWYRNRKNLRDAISPFERHEMYSTYSTPTWFFMETRATIWNYSSGMKNLTLRASGHSQSLLYLCNRRPLHAYRPLSSNL